MGELNKGKLLFVDDDPLSREGFKIAFGKKYNCILCENAAKAEDEMDSDISVAIIDIRMAGKNGFDLCNTIKKDYPDLPVIFYSGYPEDKHPIDVINEHQPFAFVTKGGDLNLLENAIIKAQEFHQRTNQPISPDFLESKMGDAANLLLPNDTKHNDPAQYIKHFLIRCKKAALLNIHTIRSRGDVLIPKNREYKHIIDTCLKAIDARISIYLGGDKGTGKTVLPHYLGKLLPDKPFVYIDCHNSALINDGYLDNQHFELASEGILFLDDIHRLSNIDQNKILAWLDKNRLEKDISLIASGPNHLTEQFRSYGIHEQLLSEISSVNLSLPIIKEMTSEIDDFIKYFSKKYKNGVQLNEMMHSEIDYFKSREWIGNFHELEQTIKKYYEDDIKIDFETIPESLREKLITDILNKCNDNVSKAAQYLGMKRPRLYQLIENMNISIKKRAYTNKK